MLNSILGIKRVEIHLCTIQDQNILHTTQVTYDLEGSTVITAQN